MGLYRKFLSNTRKPQGFLGKLMIGMMNSGHAKMADWGMDQFPDMESRQMIELGCGGGRNAGELLRRFPQAQITAVDYSPLSVEKAKEYNEKQIMSGRCTVQEENVTALPFSDESFDLATAFETVYFWPGLDRCFREVHRILKPGGYFCIVNESDGEDAASLQYENIIDGMKVYTVSQLTDALRSAGFKEVSRIHHKKKPWIAVIAKK